MKNIKQILKHLAISGATTALAVIIFAPANVYAGYFNDASIYGVFATTTSAGNDSIVIYRDLTLFTGTSCVVFRKATTTWDRHMTNTDCTGGYKTRLLTNNFPYGQAAGYGTRNDSNLTNIEGPLRDGQYRYFFWATSTNAYTASCQPLNTDQEDECVFALPQSANSARIDFTVVNGQIYSSDFLEDQGAFSTETRIISIDPDDNDIVASGQRTALNVTAYINSENVGDYILYTVYSRDRLFQTNEFQFKVQATTSGMFSYGTSTDQILQDGSYSSAVRISPYYILGLIPGTPIDSESTNWSVGAESAFGSSTLAIWNFLEGNGVDENGNPISAANMQSCSFSLSGFSLAACLKWLIVPDIGDTVSLVNSVEIPFLTRFLVILTTTASSSLPTIEYNFGDTSVFGTTIGDLHFDPFGYLTQASSLVHAAVSDQDDPKNVWEIFEIPITYVVYLWLGFIIISDLLGLYLSRKQ